jgi:hypothetical protein
MRAELESLDIGFWHPFGAYTGLSASEILEWKSSEVERFGWTLWSFVHSSSASAWLAHLQGVKGPVYALCSHSPAARDPDLSRGSHRASHFRYIGSSEWQSMPEPELMKVTNPFKRNGLALGFRVDRVLPMSPVVPPFKVEWYSRSESRWRSDPLPTRGEYLIRRGGAASLRPICALLQLAEPYLVELRGEASATS